MLFVVCRGGRRRRQEREETRKWSCGGGGSREEESEEKILKGVKRRGKGGRGIGGALRIKELRERGRGGRKLWERSEVSRESVSLWRKHQITK